MIFFWVIAFVLIATAMFTITSRNPVYSVVSLLVNFITLAILYLTLNAEFVAVIQVVVYSGAILMLFVFVIALLSSGVRPFMVGPDRMPRALVPAALLAYATLGLIVFALAGTERLEITNVAAPGAGAVGNANVFGSVADFGRALFTTNLLPFEVTAFILMVAVIGVVLLAGEAPPMKGFAHKRPRRAAREPIVRSK